MVESKITHEAVVSDIEVHQREAIMVKIKNMDLSSVQKLLGTKDPYLEIPAEVDEAGEWREGDQLELTLENKEVEKA